MTGPFFLSSAVHLFLKKVVESAIAIGGTIPPIITAAIIQVLPSAIAAVPNTYAALLKGPPISIAIIAASTTESNSLLVSPRLVKKLERPLFNKPTSGLIASINTPMSKVPSSGKMNTGLIPSIDFGSQPNAFLRRFTSKPATKPASSAPRKPETAVSSPVGEAKVAPVVAK